MGLKMTGYTETLLKNLLGILGHLIFVKPPEKTGKGKISLRPRFATKINLLDSTRFQSPKKLKGFIEFESSYPSRGEGQG